MYVPNLSQADKHRIQVFQNSCLRFVYNVRKFDHISNYRELAMDNIESRTVKRYLTLIHKILITKTPRYLYDKLVPKFYNYSLRIRNLYIVPSFKKQKFKSSFSYLASTLYNNLSVSRDLYVH